MIVDEICRTFLLPSKKVLLSMISNNKNNFHVIVLNKDNDKKRIVFAPKKVTKICQHYVLDKYLLKLEPSDFVVSYRKKRSIIDVSKPHLKNKYFLHLDIKRFFNRMRWDTFKKVVFEKYGNTLFAKRLEKKGNEQFLKNILTYNNMIVQGSVTSPWISNIYLYDFDLFVGNLIKNIPNGAYSRYSDDIYISSTEYIPHSLIETMKNKLAEFDLRLNYTKIKYTKLNSSVRITGVTLTKDKRLVLNTNFKKSLKSNIYKVLKEGQKSSNFKSLMGSLFYLRSIDPNYFNVLQRKYQEKDIVLVDRLNNMEMK